MEGAGDGCRRDGGETTLKRSALKVTPFTLSENLGSNWVSASVNQRVECRVSRGRNGTLHRHCRCGLVSRSSISLSGR